MNKPTIDNNKACARLLLHKSLQDKYKHIRGKFSNVSIDDLFMSRQERLKLKKEEIEKQKNKKKRKEENRKKRLSNAINVEGEWDVENTTDKSKDTIKKDTVKKDKVIEDEEMSQGDDLSDADDDKEENNSVLSDKSDDISDNSEGLDESNDESVHIKQTDNDSNDDDDDADDNDEEREDKEEVEDITDSKINKEIVLNKVIKNNSKNKVELNSNKPESEVFELKVKPNNKSENKANKVEKKVKDVHKNKNLKDKLQKRKFNKESEGLEAKTKKVLVDQFFVTSTGNNYKSLVEPRNPDEVKDEHKRGNRKYRRAVMFGHVLKTKPKKNGLQYSSSNNFTKKSGYNTKQFFTNQNNVNGKEDNKNRQFDNRNNNLSSKGVDKRNAVPEKLHPSWEAKKKQSAILPFQGKKIVFDDS